MALAGRIVRFTVGSRRIGAARPALRARRVALVAGAIGLGCLMVPGGASGESPAAAADLAVTVADGHLSVRVGEAPLEAVLEAIAAQTEVAITIRGDPGMVRPQAFADLPLDAGIRRLAGERGLMMVFARADDRGVPGRLQEVRVYGDPPADDLARSPRTRMFGKRAKTPHRRRRSRRATRSSPRRTRASASPRFALSPGKRTMPRPRCWAGCSRMIRTAPCAGSRRPRSATSGARPQWHSRRGSAIRTSRCAFTRCAACT